MTDTQPVRSGFAPINGAQLWYASTGSGHPLVLVHAGIADHRMWDEQVAAFAAHYQVIRWDMRGFGQSPMVAGPYSNRSDLYEILRFLGITRAYLLGCSMGGCHQVPRRSRSGRTERLGSHGLHSDNMHGISHEEEP